MGIADARKVYAGAPPLQGVEVDTIELLAKELGRLLTGAEGVELHSQD
jgi:hypothetical protein